MATNDKSTPIGFMDKSTPIGVIDKSTPIGLSSETSPDEGAATDFERPIGTDLDETTPEPGE